VTITAEVKPRERDQAAPSGARLRRAMKAWRGPDRVTSLTDDLVLVLLRGIREDVSQIKTDMAKVKEPLGLLEAGYASLSPPRRSHRRRHGSGCASLARLPPPTMRSSRWTDHVVVSPPSSCVASAPSTLTQHREY